MLFYKLVEHHHRMITNLRNNGEYSRKFFGGPFFDDKMRQASPRIS